MCVRCFLELFSRMLWNLLRWSYRSFEAIVGQWRLGETTRGWSFNVSSDFTKIRWLHSFNIFWKCEIQFYMWILSTCFIFQYEMRLFDFIDNNIIPSLEYVHVQWQNKYRRWEDANWCIIFYIDKIKHFWLHWIFFTLGS